MSNEITIQMEIHPARSIDDKFDAISYKKGSTIIRMLQIYLGDDKFQVSNEFTFNFSF